MKNLRCRAAVLSVCSVSVTSGTWAQEAPIFEEVLVTAEKRTESLQKLVTSGHCAQRGRR